MQALFSALAEAEERQPYLQDSAVRRGTRGLAEYHLGDYGPVFFSYYPVFWKKFSGPQQRAWKGGRETFFHAYRALGMKSLQLPANSPQVR